jgi:hypothetical protein
VISNASFGQLDEFTFSTAGVERPHSKRSIGLSALSFASRYITRLCWSVLGHESSSSNTAAMRRERLLAGRRQNGSDLSGYSRNEE